MAIALSSAVLVIILVRVPTRWIEPVAVAFVVRAMVALLHSQYAFLPDSQSDAIRFERTAWLWARDGQCFDNFTTGSMLYSWLGSCVYIAFGRTALLLQIINATLGTLAVMIAMRSVHLLAPSLRYVRRIGWFTALHPSLILYSALTMREASIVLGFGVSIYWLIRWRTTNHYRYLPIAVVAAVVTQLFHTGMVTASVVIVCFGTICVVKEHTVRLTKMRFARSNLVVSVVAGFLLAVLAATVVWAITSGFGIDKLQRLSDGEVLRAIASWQSEVARGRASYLSGLSPESWLGFLLQAPIRLIYFLGAPFPWQVTSMADLWGLLDGSIFLYVCWVICRYSVKLAREHGPYGILLLVAFCAIAGFSVATSNYGTAFRHRAKFVPLLLILVVYGEYLMVRRSGSSHSLAV